MASKQAYTEKQKKDYRKKRDKYICCPKCGKNIITLRVKKSNEKMNFSLRSCRDFFADGFGEIFYNCQHCGHRWAEVYALVDIDVPTQG